MSFFSKFSKYPRFKKGYKCLVCGSVFSKRVAKKSDECCPRCGAMSSGEDSVYFTIRIPVNQAAKFIIDHGVSMRGYYNKEKKKDEK